MTKLVTKAVLPGGVKDAPVKPAWDDWPEDKQNEAEELPFNVLTREQAQDLQARHPPISVWRVVGVQALVGVAIALLAFLWTGQSKTAWSALWGVASVVIPNALMAWGMTGLFRGMPAAAVLGFMFWELIKIMTAVAILAVAAVWVSDLNWLALLAGLVGCLKVNWLALLWQGRSSQIKSLINTQDGI